MKLGLQPVKTCIACGVTATLDKFYFVSHDRTKRDAKCRRCRNDARGANRRKRSERDKSGKPNVNEHCIGRFLVVRLPDGSLETVRREVA